VTCGIKIDRGPAINIALRKFNRKRVGATQICKMKFHRSCNQLGNCVGTSTGAGAPAVRSSAEKGKVQQRSASEAAIKGLLRCQGGRAMHG